MSAEFSSGNSGGLLTSTILSATTADCGEFAENSATTPFAYIYIYIYTHIYIYIYIYICIS